MTSFRWNLKERLLIDKTYQQCTPPCLWRGMQKKREINAGEDENRVYAVLLIGISPPKETVTLDIVSMVADTCILRIGVMSLFIVYSAVDVLVSHHILHTMVLVCFSGSAGAEHCQVQWCPGDLLQYPGDPAGDCAAI